MKNKEIKLEGLKGLNFKFDKIIEDSSKSKGSPLPVFLKVSPTLTVFKLKKDISQKVDMPIDRLTLILFGQVLSDEAQLKDYPDLFDKALINVIARNHNVANKTLVVQQSSGSDNLQDNNAQTNNSQLFFATNKIGNNGCNNLQEPLANNDDGFLYLVYAMLKNLINSLVAFLFGNKEENGQELQPYDRIDSFRR